MNRLYDLGRAARAALGLLAVPAGAASQAAPAAPEIVVTAPGGSVDAAVMVTASDLRRAGAPDLLNALARAAPALSLADGTGNPFQPNLVYRGFTASPLEGSAEGLAVYLDGARFNLPFGDTVDLSLVPAVALDAVTVTDATFVYGLNALGGAAVLTTRTGRTAPGVRFSLRGGSFNALASTAEAGGSHGAASAYIAFESDHDGGWRVHSPSDRYAGFADAGWDGASAGVHLKLSYADARLTGNGATPLKLALADRRAVFTYPDATATTLFRASLHPYWQIGPHTRAEATLYGLVYRQAALNGDASEIAACDDRPARLCAGDDAIRDLTGRRVADVLGTGGTGYGVVNRSTTRTDGGGILIQLTDTRRVLAGDNSLTVGGSYDDAATRFQSFTDLGAIGPDGGVRDLGSTIVLDGGGLAPVRLRASSGYTGVFAVDRVELLPGLTAEIGVRWNEAIVRLRDEIGTALNGDHRFTRINPGGELYWRVAPAVTLRAGYSEANRAPSPAELSCADPQAPCSLANFFLGDPPLRQVVAHSFTVGARGEARTGGWTFGYRLDLYQTDTGDDIAMIASDIPGRAYFQNVGGTRRQGVEATFTATREAWRMTAGYALTDATFQSPLTLTSPLNPVAAADGTIAVRPGDRIPSVPRHRGTVSVDYDRDGWGIGADVQAQTGVRFFGDEIGALGETGAYALVALRGHVRAGRALSLFADIRNLFDSHDVTYGLLADATAVFPAQTDPRFVGEGAPRRLRVGVRAEL